MRRLRVALLQLSTSPRLADGRPDQAAHLALGAAYCRRARALGADLAVFPEMWNIGYAGFAAAGPAGDLWRSPRGWAAPAPPPASGSIPALTRADWEAQAATAASPFVAGFQALARELELAIAVTYLEAAPAGPRNAVTLFDRQGRPAFTYAKVHTCDFDYPEAACAPGDDFPVATLDTAAGPVAVGAMICFDREFPEAARVLMLNGAELIIIPNACEMEANRLGQLRARAFENMVGVALANYAAPQENGASAAFSPAAFDPAGRSRDTLVTLAGPAPGVYLADFDLEVLRAWREREVWGDAFRRPHRYGALTAAAARPPFQRVNAAGEPYPRARR